MTGCKPIRVSVWSQHIAALGHACLWADFFSVYEFGYGLHHLTSHEALLPFVVV